MVKTLKNLLQKNQESFEAESWYVHMYHRGLKVYQVCSNDDPRLTFSQNVLKATAET